MSTKQCLNLTDHDIFVIFFKRPSYNYLYFIQKLQGNLHKCNSKLFTARVTKNIRLDIF